MPAEVYSVTVQTARLPHLTPDLIERAYRECSAGFVDAIKGWYRSKPDTFFDGPNHPADRARAYMRGVIRGWMAGDSTADALHAVFMGINSEGVAYGLRLHQLGGTIRPKNKLALAIPIAPQAHGVRPMEFQQLISRKLFLIENHDDPDLIGTLAWSDKNGELHAAYALRKSSYVPPLKERKGYDALPTDEELASMAREVLTEWLKRHLA